MPSVKDELKQQAVQILKNALNESKKEPVIQQEQQQSQEIPTHSPPPKP